VNIGASGSFVSRDGTGADRTTTSPPGPSTSSPRRSGTSCAAGSTRPTRDQELKCADTEINVLISIEDVTAAVTQDTEKLPPAEQFKERRKRMLTIEKESEEKTKLNSKVVTLYGGGKYHLYRSQRYTDVRLVFAPEFSLAFFGGDVDNFEYPRFDHDFALLRVYDDKTGQPIHPEHYLKWSRTGASDGELLFVVGHPGRTERLHTLDHVLYDRDRGLPMKLNALWRREVQLHSFIDRGGDNPRQAAGDFFGVQNSRKATTGALAALLDPQFIAAKADAEKSLRAAIDANPTYKSQWGDAWDKPRRRPQEASRVRHAPRRVPAAHALLHARVDGREHRPPHRRTAKAERRALTGVRRRRPESGLFELYSPAPIDDGIEISRLTSYISYIAERLGARRSAGREDPRRPLARRPCRRDRPRYEAQGPGGAEEAGRGGVAAVEASDDPVIQLMRTIDPETRAIRKRFEDEVEAVDRDNYAKIAAADFAVRGESTYPDATGTLRIAFGVVKGYREDDGREVPPFTKLAGMYQRWRDRDGARREEPPFMLPPRWINRRSRADESTPLDFVLTADIIGGNSGSPVINRAGELVGLIFDGNLQSLAQDYAYDERQARAVAVDARAILHALRVMYDAEPLVRELTAP
jgi:hypothetical protein